LGLTGLRAEKSEGRLDAKSGQAVAVFHAGPAEATLVRVVGDLKGLVGFLDVGCGRIGVHEGLGWCVISDPVRWQGIFGGERGVPGRVADSTSGVFGAGEPQEGEQESQQEEGVLHGVHAKAFSKVGPVYRFEGIG
jgi:hypothetical protein